MADKFDGLGIPEDSLNHLIASFKEISDTFRDILKKQQVPQDSLNHLIASFKEISNTFRDILKKQQERKAEEAVAGTKPE